MRNTEGKDVIKATRRKGRATLKAERKMKMREEKLQVWRNFKKSSGNKGLKGCNTILGMTWLTKYNPATNWKNGTMSFYHDGKTHRLDTQSNPSTPSLPSLTTIHTTKTTIQLCSIQQIKRIIRHNKAEYIILASANTQVDSSSTSSTNPEAQSVLSEFSDVFPTELPSHLPPRRDVDHRIELTQNSPPTLRSVYRMSLAELDPSF